MIDMLQYIDELKEIKKLVEDQKPRYLIVDKINEFIGFKQKEVDELLSSQGDINNFLERKKSVVEITSNQDNE